MLISVLTGALALAVSIGAVVCWVMVLAKIFKEHVGLGVLGLLVTPFAYIYGWVKVRPYNILRVMIIWTVCGGLMVLSMAGALLPAVSGATSRAKLTQAGNMGRSILMAVQLANMDAEAMGSPAVWPTTTGERRTASSTEYFRKLMVDGTVQDLDAAAFGLPGLPKVQSPDAAALLSENNAWCTLACPPEQADELPGSTPFLFTRNLEIAVLDGSVSLRLTDTAPFGLKGAVVIARDGVMTTLENDDLQQYAESLNPAYLGNVLKP